MTTHNPKNERIRRQYFIYLKEAKRQSEATVDAVASALAQFEAETKHKNFNAFHFQQAIAFKKHLAEQTSKKTGKRLSKATMYAMLAHLKRFFQWLSQMPGYKSTVQYPDAEYFNMSDNDARIATARREQVGPTLDQVRLALSKMPVQSDIERRNRALVAFTILMVHAIARLLR